eukprot:3902222-Rhodomonas_salina.1
MNTKGALPVRSVSLQQSASVQHERGESRPCAFRGCTAGSTAAGEIVLEFETERRSERGSRPGGRSGVWEAALSSAAA